MVLSCSCVLLKISAVLALIILVVKYYLKFTSAWCRSQTCLVGKTAIVTGANTGIGYETALDLAKRGGRVILACRNKEAAEKAREKIIKATQNDNVVVKLVDMSSLASVRAFAKEIKETEARLDILINNAGVVGYDNAPKSEDGLELLMQINYFSSFLLTILLLDILKKSSPSRIVNVSSIGAAYSNLTAQNVNIINKPARRYSYLNSKLCNILFTKELSKKLQGTNVTVYSLHPGAVKTDIFRNFEGVVKTLTNLASVLFFKTCEEGAQTTIHVATQKGIEQYNGEHFAECRRVATYKTAKDEGLAKKVWEKTEALVKLQPSEAI